MSIHRVNLLDAEGHLKELADLAVQGEQVLIHLGDGNIMKLVVEAKEQPERVAGLHQGQGWMSDDFDEPLEDVFGPGEDV